MIGYGGINVVERGYSEINLVGQGTVRFICLNMASRINIVQNRVQ
jgi:hypothetical protein